MRSQAVFAIFFNLFCSLKRSCIKNHNEHFRDTERTEKSAKEREKEKRQRTKSFLVGRFRFLPFAASLSSCSFLCATSCSHCSILKYTELMRFMRSNSDKWVGSRPSGRVNAPVCALNFAVKLYVPLLPGTEPPARDGSRKARDGSMPCAAAASCKA